MKGFASVSFFHVFNRTVKPSDLLKGAHTWSLDGVDWTHTRHAYRGEDYEFSIDVFRGRKTGKKGWRMMVVREGWWTADKPDPFRNTQTAHFLAGDRKEALAWFRRRDEESRAAP